MSESLRTKLTRFAFNFFPCYRRTGARLTYIAHDYTEVRVKLPLYRLAAAQQRLNQLVGDCAIIQRFSPAYLLGTPACCKLYDYRQHRWLDVAGRAPRTAHCRRIRVRRRRRRPRRHDAQSSTRWPMRCWAS